MTLVDSLTDFTCKRFSRHIAMGVVPLEGGLYAKVQFWIHWAICPFCRRYWEEIKAIGGVQRTECDAHSAAHAHVADFKRRLKETLIKKAS